MKKITHYLFPAFVFILLVFLCSCGKSSENDPIILEKTPEQLNRIYDDIDFSILTSELEQSFKVDNCFSADGNHDDIHELYFGGSLDNDDYPFSPVLVCENADSHKMVVYAHFGAAGNTSVHNTESGDVILEQGYYTSGITDISFRKWEINGWVDGFAMYVGSENYDDNYDVVSYECEEAQINGVSYRSKEDFDSQMNQLGFIAPVDVTFPLKSNYYINSDLSQIVSGYITHLNNDTNHSVFSGDFDRDGEQEYLIVIYNYLSHWLDNLQCGETEPEVIEEYMRNFLFDTQTGVLLDNVNNDVYFRTFDLGFSVCSESPDISMDSGILRIYDGNTIVFRKYCVPSCETLNGGELTSNMELTCSRLLKTYEDSGCSDVKIKLCDIALVPGDEIVCVYTCDGINMVDIYVIYDGFCERIFHDDDYSGNSVFLTNVNERNYLFTYSQEMLQSYFQEYAYKLIYFDEYGCKRTEKEDAIFLDSDGISKRDQAFFDTVNNYLSYSTVCCDQYELTGYSTMNASETNYLDNSGSSYISIINCDTSKSGIVHVKKTWLNFRSGPSTEYSRILIDKKDKKSYVKQANGSIVTILDVENTSEAKNPIWVKIQIKYKGKVLTGYSSQTYIDLPSITHISDNEAMKIELNTNCDNIEWTSSDPAIASIDEYGNLTGWSKGLVLITASSGNVKDSCLIAVD